MAADHNTRPWNHVPPVNTNIGSATLLIAAGVATQALIIANEDATTAIRVRFDGSDATNTMGLLLLAGRTLYFANGEVPSGKVSAFCASAVPVSVHYIQ